MSPPQVNPLQRPARIAIVGSGPSGFYTAAALFKQNEQPVEVDFYDRLPTPYGLVRGGSSEHQGRDPGLREAGATR
jgi:ferredoxin--NADP+ reductase